MIDNIIIDDAKITLTSKDTYPYSYMFSSPKVHNVKYGLSTTYVGASAFANCTNMISVKFPEEITDIKRRAFENCSRLNNVVIPENIKYIGANVWDGCTSLNNITFETSNPESISNNSTLPTNCKVYIPTDSKYAFASSKVSELNPNTVNYYTKSAWNEFTYIPARNFKDGVDYYYDRWTHIAPNEQTIEENNRKVIEKVIFAQNTLNVEVGSKTELKFTINPTDATNTKLYAIYDRENATNVAEVMEINSDNIYIIAKAIGSIRVSLYAESGAYDYCEINVRAKS